MWASKGRPKDEQRKQGSQGGNRSRRSSMSPPRSIVEDDDDDIFVVARMMMGAAALDTTGLVGKWKQAKECAAILSTAKKMKNAAKLKTLQRTPYPMILNRIRMLLERLGELNARSDLPTARTVSLKGSSTAHSSQGHKTDMEVMEQMQAAHVIHALTPKASISPVTNHGEIQAARVREATLSELSLILSYVSEFLGKLPEETRREMCGVAKMEHFKKEEVIFHCGEDADKFYIILTGLVEVAEKVSTNENEERTVIANLKKGQSFGDQAILNNRRRGATCLTITNCTFLTVGKTDFVQVFGPYFFEQKRLAMNFLRQNVYIFRDIPRNLFINMVLYMIKSEYQAGREWDVSKEKYIYFIVKGTCTLEALDRRTPLDGPKRIMRTEGVPTVGESGVLANVEIHEGRAVGTLGKEEQIRALRRAMIPKKTLAKLGPGRWFGGGHRILGDGDIQSSLKVIADTSLDVYVLPVDDFVNYADAELVRRVREDACFFQTYFCGRVGLADVDAVIGHSQTAMIENTVYAHRESTRITPRRERKRRGTKHQVRDSQTRFSARTQAIFNYVAELRNALQSEIEDAQYDKGTPAERFWATPSFTNTNVQNRLGPVLGVIYSDGLGPLAEKVDKLESRSKRQEEKSGVDELKWFWELDGAPPDENAPDSDNSEQRNTTSPCINTHQSAANEVEFNLPPRPATSMSCRNRQESFFEDAEPPPRPSTASCAQRSRRPGELTAACIMWERMSQPQTPGLRQCLTYAEISRNHTEQKRALFGVRKISEEGGDHADCG